FSPHLLIQQQDNEIANAVLLRHGFLGCSPIQPTVAIQLECLELYHQIRRRQSSFGIQTFTKVLCALHNVTYSSSLRVQFSTAFDIYLNMLRNIHSRVNQALGRDPINWHMNGACPCCSFEQSDEPKLDPRRLHSMDGNHSAKRIDGSGSTDPHVFVSNFFLADAAVERFKDDVRSRPVDRILNQNDNCTENWTAARAVEENKVLVFKQTGIFIMACRHGFVECIAEMKHSGEL
ncbi:hypothetical protein EDB19DRAFT_1625560, partial [Suillus lakei]